MKIGFLVWEYPPTIVGGLGTYAENIAPTFVKMGHDVTVLTLNRGSGLKTREVMEGVEVHRPIIADGSSVFPLIVSESVKQWGAGIRFFSDIALYNLLSASKLLNDLMLKEGYSFDVVCFHDWLSSIGGLMVKGNSKIPCVFHVHSTEWGRTAGRCSDTVLRLEETAAQRADRVITVSNAMKEDLANHSWDKEKVDVVWNGVDPQRYSPDRYGDEAKSKVRARYGVKADEAMILFVGRLITIKGVMNLVQAMPQVLKSYPKSKLVILGQGELEEEVVRTASRLGVSDAVKVRFQFVSEDERIMHYAASDLCVFPSTYEPFGIVSLEAMSMGKPVVVGASGVVGFREQIVPNGQEQCGIHVDGSSSKDIAWGIQEALSDPKRAKAWGLAGRKRVTQFFTWNRAAEETLGIYQNVVSRGSASQ
ncbi:MAG: glycosyltransferase family 4 protein [Thaumarchaeota archaeon]|nr:glycosyltransferase family 4 protein [Nitrososphaerota archaeon]